MCKKVKTVEQYLTEYQEKFKTVEEYKKELQEVSINQKPKECIAYHIHPWTEWVRKKIALKELINK